jgi:uncharacterized protein YndB with AHSA1/START domain
MTKHPQTDAKPAFLVERSYRATAAELWELWTTKEGFESWWGPEGFRVEVHKIEPRVGGALDYDMIADAPEQIAAMKEANMPVAHGTHGTFTELVLHQRLRLTHIIDFIPGIEAYENNIVVTFVPEGSQLRMAVHIQPHITDEWTARSVEGFTSQLQKLPAALERRRATR